MKLEGIDEKFKAIWKRYPRALGKKAAERHFKATVKTEEDWTAIKTALEYYKDANSKDRVEEKYILHGSTWFNNWEDYR